MASPEPDKIEPVTLYVREGIGVFLFEFRLKPVKYCMVRGPLIGPLIVRRMVDADGIPGLRMGPV
jgi:hypothetical protein